MHMCMCLGINCNVSVWTSSARHCVVAHTKEGSMFQNYKQLLEFLLVSLSLAVSSVLPWFSAYVLVCLI